MLLCEDTLLPYDKELKLGDHQCRMMGGTGRVLWIHCAKAKRNEATSSSTRALLPRIVCRWTGTSSSWRLATGTCRKTRTSGQNGRY